VQWADLEKKFEKRSHFAIKVKQNTESDVFFKSLLHSMDMQLIGVVGDKYYRCHNFHAA